MGILYAYMHTYIYIYIHSLYICSQGLVMISGKFWIDLFFLEQPHPTPFDASSYLFLYKLICFTDGQMLD